MPVIQQENGIKSVKGLPQRWGVRAYHALKAARGDQLGSVTPEYQEMAQLIDQVTDGALPIDATDAQLCIMAERCANECARFAAFIHDKKQLAAKMADICRIRGVQAHTTKCGKPEPVISRCTDAAWWRRQLRKVHGRHHEHAAIRLGLVSTQTGKYCSDEAVKRRIAQNRRNANALKAVTMTNLDTDQEMTLDVVASKGTSNKKNRRGEVMLRMAGCDQVARLLGHVGVFVTETAPSKYHAVLEKSGKPNPKYNGASPLQAQAYLNNVWQLTRAQNGRDGIAPYGFRIAEPHHDGCVHWHGIYFMAPEHIETFKANLTKYATAEDSEELAGDITPRIKFVMIDPKEGSAAAYMMKYVAKNIGENEIREDKNGNALITKEMRVDAWAGTWGIRQFQPIGQPPVTVWREFRRVPEDAIKGNDVPSHIQAAHAACQRIESKTEKDLLGKPVVIHAANWAEYIQAQGGIKVGEIKTKTRDYSGAVMIPYKSKAKAKRGKFYFRGIRTITKKQPVFSGGVVGGYQIAIAAPLVMAEGRYGLTEAEKPVGVYCKAEREVIYKSTRYTWKKSGGGVAVAFPWSSVNNCTVKPHWKPTGQDEPPIFNDSEWFDSLEADQVLFADSIDLQEEVKRHRQQAEERKKNTVWTRSRTSDLLEKRAKHES